MLVLMRFHHSLYNDQGVIIWASKRKRRKVRYLSNGPPWTGRHKTTRRRANRQERHQTKVDLRNA